MIVDRKMPLDITSVVKWGEGRSVRCVHKRELPEGTPLQSINILIPAKQFPNFLASGIALCAPHLIVQFLIKSHIPKKYNV
jgi:hypothetical protein